MARGEGETWLLTWSLVGGLSKETSSEKLLLLLGLGGSSDAYQIPSGALGEQRELWLGDNFAPL